MEDIKFNKKQQEAYDKIIEGKNLILTSSAGCGKSEVIKQAKVDLEKKYFKNVAITSTTGVSANLIGGRTLHSQLGIGLGTGSYKKLLAMIKERPMILARWRHLQVLIVDEASMLPVELFEKLEHLARTIRKDPAPFGNIQIIIVADFLQLPVVRPNNTGNDKLLFESPVWKKCMTETVYLTQVMRQTDELFIRVLNKVRVCNIDDEVKETLKSREIKYFSKEGFIPTLIFATNAKVDKTNKKYYDKLTGEEYKYELKKKWNKRIAYKEKYDNLIRFEEELYLKVGAQVLYLVNSPDNPNLYNGSRGVVTKFQSGLPVVLFTTGKETFEATVSDSTLDIMEDDKLIMSYTQIPLKLAFSISCHRSQSQSLSLLRLDFNGFFEFSQAYVALSRARSLDGLYIRNLDFNVIKADKRCIDFYKNLEAQESK
jgi:ATP-dependent DNA helicase PIF1